MNAFLMKWLSLGTVALVMVAALVLAHSIQNRKPASPQRLALLDSNAEAVSVAFAASAGRGD